MVFSFRFRGCANRDLDAIPIPREPSDGVIAFWGNRVAGEPKSVIDYGARAGRTRITRGRWRMQNAEGRPHELGKPAPYRRGCLKTRTWTAPLACGKLAVMSRTNDAIHYPVRRFKSLAVGLKELEPFIRGGAHLMNGKPFKQLQGMRSREAVANWMICAAANFEHGSERMSFTSDPTGGDGVIYDSLTQRTWRTEHIMVRRNLTAADEATAKSIETKILEAVAKKQAKGGAAYASGKQLVVFLDSGGGEWHPNKVARGLPTPLLFDEVWVVGLHGSIENGYVYGVTQLDLTRGNAPIWLVLIDQSFEGWKVTPVQ